MAEISSTTGHEGRASGNLAVNLPQQEQRARRDMQEALRQQERRLLQSVRRAMQEALHQQDRRVQAAMRREVQEALRQQGQRVETAICREVRGALRGQEERVQQELKLRAEVENARWEAAIRQLEERVATPPPTSQHECAVGGEGGVERVQQNSESVVARIDVPFTELQKPSGTESASASAVEAMLEAALLSASRDGVVEDARRLLQAGVAVNCRGDTGLTPLMYAAQACRPDVISLLLQGGAQVHCRSPWGWTALHFALLLNCGASCVLLLIAAGADVNSRCVNGASPLHLAAMAGNERAARALLEAGADPGVKDDQGKAPADLAGTFYLRKLLEP